MNENHNNNKKNKLSKLSTLWNQNKNKRREGGKIERN